MYRLWTIVRTEFQREFSNPAMWIFFLVLPLIFTASVGGQMSGASTPAAESVEREAFATLPVVRGDTGALADTFVALLEDQALEVVTTTGLPEEGFGLVIPAGFSDALLAGEGVTVTLRLDASDAQSWAVEEAVRAARAQLWLAVQVVRVGAEVAESQGYLVSEAERAAFYESFWLDIETVMAQPVLRVKDRGSGARSVTDAEQASAGQIITWVQVTLLGASAVLVNERLSGTLQRLAIAPASGALILGGKLLARLCLGLAQMVLLFVGGAVLFRVGWGQSPLAVTLVSLAFALATTGLGLLLATVVKTPVQAGSINTGLAMLLAALGGAWWPLEITPTLYQQVVHVLPTTWAMQAYTNILVRGVGVEDVLVDVTVLLGFALGFFILGVWRYERSRI